MTVLLSGAYLQEYLEVGEHALGVQGLLFLVALFLLVSVRAQQARQEDVLVVHRQVQPVS